MNAIEVRDLEKSYRNTGKKNEVKALLPATFQVNKSELFGIIGPDGSGKTTLFRILATLILADKGEAYIEGLDVVKNFREIRRLIGYMPGRFSLYQDLSVEENLKFFASVFSSNIEENYYLIEDIYRQIEPFKTRRAGKLSGGMKQKLALCCALIHKPSVLLLDEPTTGVDPVSRKEFWQMLKRLQMHGITIVVSTPYMDEANLCERVMLMKDGKILDIESPSAVVGKYPRKLYSVKSDNIAQSLKILRANPDVETAFSFGDSIHITFRNDVKTIDAQPISPSIEDYFMLLSH
ncbi:MAG: ABC transporter ATP-binding protein [Bacteroidales bacterium]|jgi:ABC-type multidrug transport system ATPase subunit|nr:ABC transporter ATP-binding protein [Bacteroidales bacterium]